MNDIYIQPQLLRDILALVSSETQNVHMKRISARKK